MHSIWTNAKLPDDALAQLQAGVSKYRLIPATNLSALNLTGSPSDPLLEEAEIAFGQPLPEQIKLSPRIQWVHLTSAGYTAYDRDDLKLAMKSRGARLTTSSGVYDEPCAQHALAMMMAFARQLPQSLKTQQSDQSWPAAERRLNSFLLNGQTAVFFGFGSIAKRLCELLAPLQMKLIGVRRQPSGDEPIAMIRQNQVAEVLTRADHVINLLPSNESTDGLFGPEWFRLMKPGCFFYNIGRGATVDQEALIESLASGRVAGAYLDVMTPEPLPQENPLWSAPNCFITPHTAGGFDNEMHRLVEHFLSNLNRFERNQSLLNQVI